MPTRSAPPDLAAALPRRPITVRPPPPLGPMATVGLFGMLLGLLALVLGWLGPDLARDWRIGRDLAAADGARIEQARCRSGLFVFKVCDIAYTDSRAGAEQAGRCGISTSTRRARSASPCCARVPIRPPSRPRSGWTS